jgi:membrane-bound lytic murein transglycosylase MltF
MLNKVFPLFFLFLLTPTLLQAKTLILFGTNSQSYQYEQLLNALSYVPEKQYQLSSYQGELPKDRAFDFMNLNKGVDIITGGATLARENKSTPIRIPILKGLNGWRMPLIHKNRENIFTNIQSLAAFKRLIPGQFHRWSDTKILESNNIQVAKGSDYEGLFYMLEKGRIDYFPRSVLEIDAELKAHQDLNILIDKRVLIHYPTAYYFYVGKDNPLLAHDILLGLERAISDGSFDKIFNKHHGEIVKNIRKTKRKVFSLENPFLSEHTPLLRKNLWIDLHPESPNLIE